MLIAFVDALNTQSSPSPMYGMIVNPFKVELYKIHKVVAADSGADKEVALACLGHLNWDRIPGAPTVLADLLPYLRHAMVPFALQQLEVRPTHSAKSESDDEQEEEEGEGGAQRKKPRLDVPPQQDTHLFSDEEVGELSCNFCKLYDDTMLCCSHGWGNDVSKYFMQSLFNIAAFKLPNCKTYISTSTSMTQVIAVHTKAGAVGRRVPPSPIPPTTLSSRSSSS